MLDLLVAKAPPYDLILSDGKDSVGVQLVPDHDALGRNPVEASSLKTTTGNQSYSDLEPPYMVIPQDDWTGGRGSPEFEKDVTRYRDGLRVNAERSTGLIMGPREKYSAGIRKDMRLLPGSMRLTGLTGGRQYLATRNVTDQETDAVEIWLWVRKKGTPKAALTVRVRDDDGGAIDTVLQTDTLAVADANDLVSELKIFTITSETLSNATAYWVEVVGHDDDSDENRWEVGVSEAAGTTKESADGVTYSSSAVDLYYRVVEADDQTGGILFEYKKSEYFMTKPADGSASTLYINGARGLAASNAGTLDVLIASTAHGLSAAKAIGAVLMIIEGTGDTEEINFRTITGVPSSMKFSVDEDWLITHDATTVWVVLGAHVWNEIDVSARISAPVTDVHISSQGYAYFCQGEEDVIIRMKEEVSGGGWLRTLADDSTNKAVFMSEYINTGQKIVRTNGDGTVSECATPTTWTDLASWTSALAVGDEWDRITGVEKYKDYQLADAVTIFKEEGPWLYQNGTVDEMRTPEMSAIASYKNGRASAVQGSYLYFSVQNTVWRFYNPEFSDVGPTADDGLPEDRQGPITGFAAYPGRVLACIDAGASGYSSVMVSTGGSAWHELYRAPLGQRIFALDFQVVPGTQVDWLWVRQGADIVGIPFPSETYDPFQDSNYPFSHEFVIEYSSITAGLYDAWKYLEALKLRSINLVEDTTWLEADIRTDEDDDWETLPYIFDDSPVQSQPFGDDYGMSGQVLYLRIRGYSRDKSESPKLVASAISGVTVAQPKFAYSVTAGIFINDKNGDKIERSPVDRIDLLDEWSGQARPLKVRSVNPLYDGKKVFLMPLTVRPVETAEDQDEYEYHINLAMQEA